MPETNEKCQAGCPHPREAHQTNPLHHEDLCFGCVKDHGGAPNTEDWHPFETIASLRARIAELEGERDELRGLIGASDAGPLFERLDYQHLQIAELELELGTARGHAAYNKQKYQSQYAEAARLQGALTLADSRIAELEQDVAKSERDYWELHTGLTARIGEQAGIIREISRIVKHVGGSATLARTVVLAESERLTDEACVEVASLICSKLGKGGRDENDQNYGPSNRGLVRDLVRAARGVKERG